jgi:HupE / UreJ protein
MIGRFIGVGFHHIVALDALDHLLFLLALAACYRFRDWRHGLTVVSAFTVGHSLTLALATLNIVRFPTRLVEFLIPCTIILAGAENLLDRRRRPQGWQRPALAAMFGLVHGAGFATTLRDLFDGSVAVPLLGFNVGIELGQALVLTVMISVLTLADRLLRAPAGDAIHALAWRIRMTSVAAAGMAFVMAAQRAPW